MRKQATDLEKIFIKDIYDKEQSCKIYKQLLKINNKKTKKLIKKKKKDEPKALTDMSGKKIHRWQISIWKNPYFIFQSRKCKLKQRWSITKH